MIQVFISERAEKLNIKNANQLRLALNCSPDLASRLWKGNFEQISLKTIGLLCKTLRCQPNSLFKFIPDETKE